MRHHQAERRPDRKPARAVPIERCQRARAGAHGRDTGSIRTAQRGTFGRKVRRQGKQHARKLTPFGSCRALAESRGSTTRRSDGQTGSRRAPCRSSGAGGPELAHTAAARDRGAPGRSVGQTAKRTNRPEPSVQVQMWGGLVPVVARNWDKLGQPKPLIQKAVPVVPVVPARKGESV